MSELTKLRERVDGLTGPSREVDALIIQALFVPKGYVEQSKINWCWCVYDGTRDRSGNGRLWEATGRLHQFKQSSPTASLDVALALITEKLPGWRREMIENGDGEGWLSVLHSPGHTSFQEGEGKTPALSLLSALLSALDQQPEGTDR